VSINKGIFIDHVFPRWVHSGGRRFSEGTSADREIQRTLMELLNQMDGFDALGQAR
jgi:ATP-dependent 26S proteasome regulatory subunit